MREFITEGVGVLRSHERPSPNRELQQPGGSVSVASRASRAAGRWVVSCRFAYGQVHTKSAFVVGCRRLPCSYGGVGSVRHRQETQGQQGSRLRAVWHQALDCI